MPASAPLVRIAAVHVRDFRGLEEVTIALDRELTVLVGRNSTGKSRLLRAIALACGDLRAERDDFTVGSAIEPTIDLELAPAGDEFDVRVRELFGTRIQLTESDERVAWRTTIRASAEGWGARAERRFLTYDVGSDRWGPASGAADVGRQHLRTLAADITPTTRNLGDEAARPGSSLRRVLENLEVDESVRSGLEAELSALGGRIVGESAALAAIRRKLDQLTTTVAGMGTADVSALPGRLEELTRLIEIALDTGTGPLPMRLHGSGAQSLASLQVQSVLYDRRLGLDGSDFPVLPVTLVEEPEAHLHPQAALDVGDLLRAIPGQVVVSTHSSHVVAAVPINSIRLVRSDDGRTHVWDLTPVDDERSTPRARRMSLAAVEWERINRFIARPFGELLFASALVIGDGASERGFLPHILRSALPKAGGICVVDPESMSMAAPLVKYAEAAGIPCVLFVDCDDDGRAHEANLPASAVRVWATGEPATDGALEQVLVEHDSEWVLEQCGILMPGVAGNALQQLTKSKGAYGSPLGRSFVERWPDPGVWPVGLQQLVEALAPANRGGDETDS